MITMRLVLLDLLATQRSLDMKLEIPAPGQQEKVDETRLSDELWISFFLTAVLIFCGVVFWLMPQWQDEEDPFAHIEDPVERQTLRDRSHFEDLDRRGVLHNLDWTDDETIRVFEAGPRRAAETACKEQTRALRDGDLSRPVRVALLRATSRRSSHAPWTCLTRLYLRGELAHLTELTSELDAFWTEVETLERHESIMARTIEDFREHGDHPETERFYRWLRRCAMDFSYGAGTSCRTLVRQHAPEQGSDLLEMIALHLGAPDVTQREVVEAARSLATLARRGQPDSWRIVETPELPDYDVDFRLGSLFLLCRMMNSPDETVQERAGRFLGRVSDVGVRVGNPNMGYRWRRTCRMAFGDVDDPQQTVLILAVMTGDEERPLDYGMETLVDAGLCELEENMPIWFCGARRWTGGNEPIRRVMAQYFTTSSYVEWYEVDELVRPETDDEAAEHEEVAEQ